MKKAIASLLIVLMITQLFATTHFVKSLAETKSLERHIIADWDDPDKSPDAPTDASIVKPYEGYEFGNGLKTGSNMVSLTKNNSCAGDTMLAFRVKNFETYSSSSVYWTNMFIYDDLNKPKALTSSSKVYYIPTAKNSAQMTRFETVSSGIYSYTTTNQTYALEKGYDGWIVFSLSDFKIDWWAGSTVASVSPDQITALHFVSDFGSETFLDEIQTFAGSISDFYSACGKKNNTTGLIRNVIADWDDATYTPTASAGTTVGVPYVGYEFGKALSTGANMITLTANSESSADTMLAMRIKDFGTYSSSSLHWTNLLIYDDENKPKALKTGAKVYYIPTSLNSAQMTRFESIVSGVYCYTTTNSTFGLEYGYDGWIIFTVSDFNIDWWNGGVTIDGVKPDKISAFHFAADLSNGTMLDEIQTFKGSVTDFKKVCNKRPSEQDDEQECKHSNLTHLDAKEATCQDSGNVECWICDDCHKIFSDSKAENEIQTYVIAKKDDHVYENGKCKWCQKTEVKPDPVVKAGKGHLLADWDNIIPQSFNADTVNGITGYGTGIIFDSAQLNIIINGKSENMFADTDDALAFYMIMPKGDEQTVHFMVLEASGEGYQLKDNVTYSLIDKTGKVTSKSSEGQTITLPGGYAGWVVLPLSMLEMHKAYPYVDGVLTPSEINNIQYFSFSGDGPYYFDQYYAIKKAEISDFAGNCNINRENVGDPPPPEEPSKELDSSDDANRNGILCNFDDVDKTAVSTAAEYSVKTQDGFNGKYIDLKITDTTSHFQISFNANARTFDSAIMMRVKVFTQKSMELYFAVHDTLKPGKTELYQLKDKRFVYFIDSKNHFYESAINAQQLIIDGGFDGYLLIPFDSLERHTGWFKHNQVLNIENITAIQFWGSASGEIGLDDITAIPSLFGYASEHSDYVPPVPNKVIVNDFEIQRIRNTADVSDNWDAYCTSDKATLSVDTDRNLDGTIALDVKTKTQADIHINSLLTADEKKSVKSFEYMASYIDNYTDRDIDITVDIKDGNLQNKIKADDLTRDFYMLCNAQTGKTSAYSFKNNCMTIPKEFCGYVIWSISSYEKHPNILSLSEVIYHIPKQSNVILDNVSIVRDIYEYITESLNSKSDTDLIFSNNDSVKISKGIITLKSANITSTKFRSDISVRRGHYIVFADGENNQVFGVQKTLKDIKYVNVFQSGKKLKSYVISNYVSNSETTKKKKHSKTSNQKDSKTVVKESDNFETAGTVELVDKLTGISVRYYDDKAFEDGTELIVTPLGNALIPNDIYQFVKSKRYIPYKLEIKKDGEDVALEGNIIISFNVPDCFDKSESLIYRVTDDDWLEDMQAKVDNNALYVFSQKTGTYFLLQDATENIGNKADIYGVDVNAGMDEDANKQIKVKRKGVRKTNSNDVLFVVIPIIVGVVVLAAIVFIILKKKNLLFFKKSKEKK